MVGKSQRSNKAPSEQWPDFRRGSNLNEKAPLPVKIPAGPGRYSSAGAKSQSSGANRTKDSVEGFAVHARTGVHGTVS